MVVYHFEHISSLFAKYDILSIFPFRIIFYIQVLKYLKMSYFLGNHGSQRWPEHYDLLQCRLGHTSDWVVYRLSFV